MAGKKTDRNPVLRARKGQGRSTPLLIGGVVAVVALLVVVIVVVANTSKPQDNATATNLNSPPATTAVGRATPPPWPAPADATAAVRAAGLPMLTEEGAVEHIHAHLDVRVDGRAIEVPAFLGIDQNRASISPLHTHDPSGVVHIESPVARRFSLGELFSEWDLSLSANNIGSLRSGDGKTVRVFVNGKQQNGNPAAVTFSAHDEVAVLYGTPQPGENVPSRYDFPSGE
ncbi:hypothetical protein GCM10022222_37960 [Amycolatopsis ultiminotia]|uniref:Uncharacterized protein n=1 Tax=Amycolatopsis ultiminotia TaxID=543629 RepID=A0ABP6WHA0_9PSEU